MTHKYVAPALGLTAFNCPYCHAYSSQSWKIILAKETRGQEVQIGGWETSLCTHCSKYSLWVRDELVFPGRDSAEIPEPSKDMPPTVVTLYYEAAKVYPISSRGAAGLLRLGMQQLMIELGQPGKNLSEDIKRLASKGISPEMEQAMHAVRIVGNNAVHPGSIEFDDKSEVALFLFTLLNMTVEQTITRPNAVSRILESKKPRDARSTDKTPKERETNNY